MCLLLLQWQFLASLEDRWKELDPASFGSVSYARLRSFVFRSFVHGWQNNDARVEDGGADKASDGDEDDDDDVEEANRRLTARSGGRSQSMDHLRQIRTRNRDQMTALDRELLRMDERHIPLPPEVQAELDRIMAGTRVSPDRGGVVWLRDFAVMLISQAERVKQYGALASHVDQDGDQAGALWSSWSSSAVVSSADVVVQLSGINQPDQQTHHRAATMASLPSAQSLAKLTQIKLDKELRDRQLQASEISRSNADLIIEAIGGDRAMHSHAGDVIRLAVSGPKHLRASSSAAALGRPVPRPFASGASPQPAFKPADSLANASTPGSVDTTRVPTQRTDVLTSDASAAAPPVSVSVGIAQVLVPDSAHVALPAMSSSRPVDADVSASAGAERPPHVDTAVEKARKWVQFAELQSEQILKQQRNGDHDDDEDTDYDDSDEDGDQAVQSAWRHDVYGDEDNDYDADEHADATTGRLRHLGLPQDDLTLWCSLSPPCAVPVPPSVNGVRRQIVFDGISVEPQSSDIADAGKPSASLPVFAPAAVALTPSRSALSVIPESSSSHSNLVGAHA